MHNLLGTTWTNVTDDCINDSIDFWKIVLSTYIVKFIVLYVRMYSDIKHKKIK